MEYRLCNFGHLIQPVSAISVVQCEFNAKARLRFSITSTKYDGGRGVLVLPFAGYGVSVEYEPGEQENLLSQGVLNALRLNENLRMGGSIVLVSWRTSPNLEPGLKLSFDCHFLANGDFGVKLPPEGTIYYSTRNPKSRQQLLEILSPPTP